MQVRWKRGTLILSLDDGSRQGERNIDPSGIAPLEIATYLVSGTGPNGNDLTEITTNHDNLTITGLSVGNWTFGATAFNAAGKALVSGTCETYINASSNNAQLVLDRLSGSGTLSVVFQWNPQQTTDTSVLELLLKGRLGEHDGNNTHHLRSCHRRRNIFSYP